MTFSDIFDFFRACSDRPEDANVAARRRFLLGAGAALGAMTLGPRTGFVGVARAEPGGAIGMDDIRERRRNRQRHGGSVNQHPRGHSRPRKNGGSRHRHGYYPGPRQPYYGVGERCHNDRRFRRRNPGLCSRHGGYRPRRHDRLCIDLGVVTICE